MSASTAPRTVSARSAGPVPDLPTAAGAVVALACTLTGNYVSSPWKSGAGEWGIDFSGNGGWAALGVMIALVGIALVAVAAAVGRARAVVADRAARRALVLALLGAVTIIVFWTGLPAVLAGGATGIALDVRHRTGAIPAPAVVALVLAAATVAAAGYLAVTG